MSTAVKKMDDPKEVVEMRESLHEFRDATKRAVRAVRDSNRGFPRPKLAAPLPTEAPAEQTPRKE